MVSNEIQVDLRFMKRRRQPNLCILTLITLIILLKLPNEILALSVSYKTSSIGFHSFHKSVSASVSKVTCHMSSNSNNSNRPSKRKQDKPKRRFAQAIDPIVTSVPPTPKPSNNNPTQDSSGKMDTNMANFMKMEGNSWKKKNVKEDSMITMKEFMNEMVERENRSPLPKSTSTSGPSRERRNKASPASYNKKDEQDSYHSPSPPRTNQPRPARPAIPETEKETYKPSRENRQQVSKSMMRNNMSIEELEAIMMKRWGTSSEEFTADPKEYEEESNYPKNNNHDNPDSNNNDDGRIFFRGKPVRDPWEKDNPPMQNTKKKKKQRWRDRDNEFYDEDDEGYEFEQQNDYGDLISPEPIGGKGSDRKSSFFSRDLGDEKQQQQDAFRAKKKERRQQTESIEKPKPVRPPRKRNPILVDEAGNQLYLTVEKALKDAGLDSDSEVDTEKSEEEAELEDEISFETLGISQPTLLSNLERLSLYTPLPVQTKTIPPALSGSDVLLPTHTGSGKTLAFLLPIIERLLQDPNHTPGVKVMIMAPGRELASQIMTVTRDMISGTGLKALLAIGGTPYHRTITSMRKNKPDIIVGTPGRLAELVVGQPGERSGKMKLNKLKTIVLDEFDALLEYKPHREPTIATLDFLNRYTSRNLQTFLCSATASDIPSSTLNQYLRDDYAIASSTENTDMITKSGMSKTVIHGVVHVPHQKRALETLRKVLHTDPIPRQILIFVENARRVDVVVDKLAEMNIIAAPLHGGTGRGGTSSTKTDRAEVNKALRDGYIGIVVATELAARGIDAPLLTHVINLDLPTDASHYAHRAGRCGRGVGRPGVVLNFTTSNKERNVPKTKFADPLGIQMWTVEPRNSKLAILNEDEEEEVQRI